MASGFIIAILLFHFTTTYNISEGIPTIQKQSQKTYVETTQRLNFEPSISENEDKIINKTIKTQKLSSFNRTKKKANLQNKKTASVESPINTSSIEEKRQALESPTILPGDRIDTQITPKQEVKESEVGKFEAIDLLKTAEKALKE